MVSAKSNYWLCVARDIVCCLTLEVLFMYEIMQIVSNILSKSTANIVCVLQLPLVEETGLEQNRIHVISP